MQYTLGGAAGWSVGWSVLVGVGWVWLGLVGVGWCWSVLVGVGRCWSVLVGVGWCWLVKAEQLATISKACLERLPPRQRPHTRQCWQPRRHTDIASSILPPSSCSLHLADHLCTSLATCLTILHLVDPWQLRPRQRRPIALDQN